jgi:hypothetical protein
VARLKEQPVRSHVLLQQTMFMVTVNVSLTVSSTMPQQSPTSGTATGNSIEDAALVHSTQELLLPSKPTIVNTLGALSFNQ